MTALGQQVSEIVREWAANQHGAAVHRITVVRSAYASSATVVNAHLRLATGERMRIVCKLSDLHIPAARGVKPDFMSNAGRETWMYESVLASDGLADAPRLFASGRNQDGGRWLLMEWAGSVDLSQVGAQAVWCDAAARLARLHVWGESHIDILSRDSLVGWDDPALHMRWARRARGSLAGYFRARGEADPLAQLWRRYRVVAEGLARMPKTLVHGDFNASNILVTRARGGNRIRIIDWETAGVGPGLLDLASLVSGRVTEKRRASMVAAYRANLGGSRLGALSAAEFDRALQWCRLALAVQWLGWSPGWTPPRAHSYDWRAEALALGREVGLVDRV